MTLRFGQVWRYDGSRGFRYMVVIDRLIGTQPIVLVNLDTMALTYVGKMEVKWIFLGGPQ